jgi:hypothetical protein
VVLVIPHGPEISRFLRNVKSSPARSLDSVLHYVPLAGSILCSFVVRTKLIEWVLVGIKNRVLYIRCGLPRLDRGLLGHLVGVDFG